ncbi:paraquat-inducible protein A [Roseicitreum antarcticum]|uniref:Paraquat-inducible protein A n=1 Tax=Roseicitreum antarcticum TaxID=564137 RepID=A0A1H3CD48_9RHOB|nr:paraquat-inducible protein A [Roseicitreum antarcticum]
MSAASPPTAAQTVPVATVARDLDDLIACPHCDTLHRVTPLAPGEQARCSQCGHRLIAPRRDAFLQVIAMGITVAILMLGALFHPFIAISVSGMTRRTSVFDAALSFSSGVLLPLTVLTVAFIILIPVMRAAALVYVLVPLVRDRPAARYAKPMLRFAEFLHPWSMAEIFIISVAVALVKVAGLAMVTFGPAFYTFVALVIVVAVQDLFMCNFSIWQALERSESSDDSRRATA